MLSTAPQGSVNDVAAEIVRLAGEGRGDDAIARQLRHFGCTRHQARKVLMEAASSRANSAEEVKELPLALLHDSPHARLISNEHVAALAKTIGEIGLQQPVVVRRMRDGATGYEVLAGLHRVKAFHELGRETIPGIVREVDDLRAELILIDENLCRHELSAAERSIAVTRRKAIYLQLHPHTAHGGNQGEDGKFQPSRQVGDTVERFTGATAKATGIAERTIQREAARGEKLGEETLKKVVGTVLDKGEELDALAKLSVEKREELVDRAAAGENVTAKTAIKQEMRAKREAELGAKQIAAPEGKFGLIVEDFEWDHVVWSRETGMDRHAANHYSVSEDAHTAQEIVERTKDRFACAAPDCLVAMWSTVQHLAIAIDVLRLRGFKYVSHYVWGKDRIGLGHWNRNKHEILLLGVKGNIPCPAKGTQWESLIAAPTSEHSAKPECFLEMLEAYFPTIPKIELNRRGAARPGWKVWGNQAEPELQPHGTSAVADGSSPKVAAAIPRRAFGGRIAAARAEAEKGSTIFMRTTLPVESTVETVPPSPVPVVESAVPAVMLLQDAE